MTTKEKDVRERVESEPDFINLKRFNFSLQQLEERYPEGCPDHIIAAALGIEEEEVEQHHNRIVQQLRAKIGVEEGP